MIKIPSASRPLTKPSKSPRIGAWVDSAYYGNLDVKGHSDLVAKYARGNITDIYAGVVATQTTPYTVHGRSSLCNVTVLRIGNLTPLEYLIQEAHKVGIRVHAWWWINYFATWGAANSILLSPYPDNDTYHNTTNGGDGIQYTATDLRATIASVIADTCFLTPGLDGVHLDYIRTDGIVTQADDDVTQLVLAIRKAVRGKELSAAVKDQIDSHIDYHQDVTGWMANGYLDTPIMMSYYHGDLVALYAQQQFDPGGRRTLWGLSSEDTGAAVSTFKGVAVRRRALHYPQVHFTTSYQVPPTHVPWMGDMYRGSMTAPQTAITKIRVTPPTDFAVTVGGVETTETYANVATHTNSGPLQLHMEGLMGAEQPYLIFYRPTTTTLEVYAGDYVTLPA